MTMDRNAVLPLIKDAYAGWSADNASRMAAALAYYAAFALAPLLIIAIEIGAAFLGGNGHHHVVRQAIFGALTPSIGRGGVQTLNGIVSATFQNRQHGFLAATIGWIVFVVAATGFFAAIEGTLDSVWHIEPHKQSLLATVRDRGKSVLIIGAISVVFLLSIVATAGLTALSGTLAAALPGWHYVVAFLELLVSFAVVVVAFGALFKFLAKTPLDWNDVIVGAVSSGVLFTIGQLLIGEYLRRLSPSSTYGAAGSFVALLLWLYYSSQIFLFGAELTKAYARRLGSKRADAASVGRTVRPTSSPVAAP